jgi:nicotinamidase-related amidase
MLGWPMPPSALLVVDVQKGFSDARWGRRNNPLCEANVARLLAAWRRRADPVVFVRHDSLEPDSPLRPDQPGNALRDELTGQPDLLVSKSVHSAFHGTPDLAAWLHAREIGAVTVCGIQTNVCAETTSRVASDLGFSLDFVLDATYTFDLQGISAEQLSAATAATLAAEFGRVVATDDLV